MKFRPLHDRVVIERIDAEAKSAGGIIIPDTAKEKPQQGKVIAVGPGGRDESGKLIPIDVKVGDRILFGKWSGTEVKIDGIEYLIMNEMSVFKCFWTMLAVLERRLWLVWGWSLSGFRVVLQSSLLDGVAFDPFSFQEDGPVSAEVDVGGRQVL